MHRYFVKLVLRKSYVRKDGRNPILLQAFINGKRVKIPMDIYVLPEEFDEELQQLKYPIRSTKPQKREVDDLNLVLNNAKAKANNIFTHHRLTDQSLTAKEFKKLYIETVSHLDFLAFVRGEIKLLEPLRSGSTIKSYNNTLIKLESFRGEVMFHHLNIALITDFDYWLRVKQKLQVNTVWKHHRNMKTFISIALKKGINFDSPYKNFKAKKTHSERDYLSKDEVDKLMHLYDSGTLPEHLHRSLRMFLFACWTGIRISDVLHLKDEMIMENQLVFVPYKSRNTKKVLRVPLNPTARAYIQNQRGNLFSSISEKQVNLDLKEIASEVKLNKHLTFHMSRHTFAMMFLEVEENKVEVLKDILGHSKMDTTMIYMHIRGETKKESMDRMHEYAKKKKERG